MKLRTSIYTAFVAFVVFSCGANESTSDETNSQADSNAISASNQVDVEVTSQPDYVYGIDISSHQNDEADILDKNADSLTFVICRATDGVTFQDSDFEKNWSLISEKGFTRGAYHFYESDDDPKAQVDNYLKTVGELSDTDFPAIVDFEGGGIDASMTVEAVQDNLNQVLQLLEERTGRTPVLYTNVSDGNKYLSSPSFEKYALWLAEYEDIKVPNLPGAWANSEWVLWQRSDDAVVDNVKNDFDIFNGSSKDFDAFLKGN